MEGYNAFIRLQHLRKEFLEQNTSSFYPWEALGLIQKQDRGFIWKK